MWAKINHVFNLILLMCLIIGIYSNLFYPFNLGSTLWIISILIVVYFFRRTRLWNRIKDFLIKYEKKIIIGSFMLMIILQILILINFKSTVFHDPFRVLHQAEWISVGNANWNFSNYYDYAPNNIVLTVILSKWLSFTRMLGLSSFFAVHFLSALILDLTIFILLRILKLISKKPLVRVGAMLFFLTNPLEYTYLLQVFYSDHLLILSFIAIIYGLLRWSSVSGRLKIFLGIEILFFTTLGIMIKPNLIVIVIALILTIIFYRILKKKMILIIPLVLMIFGCISATIISKNIQNNNYEVDQYYKLPFDSWIYMGLNSQTGGTYSEEDIQKIEDLSNYKKRVVEVPNLIKQRCSQLKPRGILSQWGTKAVILENTGALQEAYTGGFYQAPKWFTRFQPLFAGIISTIMRTWVILLMLALIKKIIHLRDNQRFSWQWMFVILTSLGLVAFHTFVWETESRYGIPLILFYWILMGINETLSDPSDSDRSFKKYIDLILTSLIALGFCLLSTIQGSANDNLKLNPHVVTAQRSQISEKYHAQTTEIRPKETISQKVRLTTKVSDFTMLTPENSKLTGTLVNVENKKVYHLTPKNDSLTFKGDLPVGTYVIKLTNLTADKQPAWMVRLPDYPLAQYPIHSSMRKLQNTYFIYKFLN